MEKSVSCTRNKYPAGLIQLGMHQRRRSKARKCVNKAQVSESFTKEKMNAKWRFSKLTNITVFAASLKDIPMGCIDSVLPKPLFKNPTLNSLTFGKHTT